MRTAYPVVAYTFPSVRPHRRLSRQTSGHICTCYSLYNSTCTRCSGSVKHPSRQYEYPPNICGLEYLTWTDRFPLLITPGLSIISGPDKKYGAINLCWKMVQSQWQGLRTKLRPLCLIDEIRKMFLSGSLFTSAGIFTNNTYHNTASQKGFLNFKSASLRWCYSTPMLYILISEERWEIWPYDMRR